MKLLYPFQEGSIAEAVIQVAELLILVAPSPELDRLAKPGK